MIIVANSCQQLPKVDKIWQKLPTIAKNCQMLPKVGIVGKIGKKWQKLTKVDKRETLAKKGNVGKSSEKLAKVGRRLQNWQNLSEVV